jgi:hypothetical protein
LQEKGGTKQEEIEFEYRKGMVPVERGPMVMRLIKKGKFRIFKALKKS